MPQFSPGEERVAIATFPVKPAGFACTAELWLASNLTKVATSGGISFIATGEDQSINFPITMPSAEGTYPVYLDVFMDGQLIGAYKATEDIVIAPAGIKLFFSQPRRTDTHFWNVYYKDIGPGGWMQVEPPQPKQLYESCVLQPADTTFLLEVHELTIQWQDTLHGLYLIQAPSFGTYTWPDIPQTSLLDTKCNIVGKITRSWSDPSGYWGDLQILSADGSPGIYFVGATVRTVIWGPTIELNREFTAVLSIASYGAASWRFIISELRYLRKYPDEAYVFSGYINLLPWPGGCEWGASGGIPPFRVCFVFVDVTVSPEPYYYPSYYEGPATGSFSMSGPAQFQLWAHPDLNKRWDPDTARINNWQCLAIRQQDR